MLFWGSLSCAGLAGVRKRGIREAYAFWGASALRGRG